MDVGSFVLQNRGFLYLREKAKMIYLKNISTPQEVFIPKCREAVHGLSLVIKGWGKEPVIDKNTTGLYFRFNMILPADIASGEHEYLLVDDAGVISTGLMIVGESTSPTEYKKTIQYEQYE